MTVADLTPSGVDTQFDWPLFALEDDVRPALARASARGSAAVLATLFRAEGGSPRGLGAQMVFANQTLSGGVSGGCIEADLALQARQVLAEGRAKRIVYGEDGPWDVRLPCGSRIEVLLEPLAPDDLALRRLLQLTQARRPAIWLTDGNERSCRPVDTPGPATPSLMAIAAVAASAAAACGSLPAPFAMFRIHTPPTRLIAIGSDPVAIAVAQMAASMGLETSLVRPKGPPTCPLSGVGYFREPIDEALARLRPDPWTAIALMTHDSDLEHAALTAALPTDAGYIGVLGSRRRIPERNARLGASGFEGAEIGRIRAPIGIPIGAQSPWEVAVSVMAEVMQAMGAAR